MTVPHLEITFLNQTNAVQLFNTSIEKRKKNLEALFDVIGHLYVKYIQTK